MIDDSALEDFLSVYVCVSREISVGIGGISVGMRGIRVIVWAIKVGMRGMGVGMRGIRVVIQRIRVGMQGMELAMLIYKYLTGILQGFC